MTIRRGATAARKLFTVHFTRKINYESRVRETVVVAETREIVQTRHGLACEAKKLLVGMMAF